MNGTYDPENGMLHFHGEQTGILHHEHWYIVHSEEDVWAMYYCGDAGSWKYEGGLVMSKTFEGFTEEKRHEIRMHYLDIVDLDYDTFCPIYGMEECAHNPYHPWTKYF